VARVVLIVNPYSSGVTRSGVDRVEGVLRADAEVVRKQTEAPGHAGELAREAAGSADAVVVFAGDGTSNEAVNGAAGLVPFGFVPGGAASVFPRALGLPRNPAAAAARIGASLREGCMRSIALGRVDGRRFLFSAGIGIDAEAVRRVDRRGRSADGQRAGNFTFALTVAQVLLEPRLRLEPRLEIDGFGSAASLFVANGRPYTYAGPVPFNVVGRAEFEGGLDFVAPRAVTPLAVPRLALRMLRGTAEGDPDVLAGHDLDAFGVRCLVPLPLQADGEDLGDVTEASFSAERGALDVLV
jgi:diacylglycerol kinase family enzyme